VRQHPHSDLLFKGAWFAGPDAAVPVSLEARLSFERAFGMNPEEQLRMEARLGAEVAKGGDWHRVELLGFDHWQAPPGILETWADAL